MDYKRFVALLFLANTTEAAHLSNIWRKYQGPSSLTLFEGEKPDQKLVDILAYALMPNHFHLVLRQKGNDGIETFMRKVATGYSMYFNLKYEHSGVVFQGRYKSAHIDSEPYFRYIFAYVHLNPFEIQEPKWEEGVVRDAGAARRFMTSYPYSSYYDYSVGKRPEHKILAQDDLPDFLSKVNDFEEVVRGFEQGRSLID